MTQSHFDQRLSACRRLHIEQVIEGFEVILGWETRNKYRILDENKQTLAYAAEQSKGFIASIMRQFLGHWRAFNVTIFNEHRQPVYHLEFPFRWIFKTLFVKNQDNKKIGYLQQRFGIFRKNFDIHDQHGKVIAKINSPLFKFWTFDFYSGSRKIGSIQKKWSGALSEIFTDRDNFVVTFEGELTADHRALMLATCFMVDIIYFEKKQK